MQTQLLPQIGNDSIYLEYLDQANGRSTKTVIDEFPFIIGRNATCNLTVESGRVSREHAEVIRHGSGYLIRDLRSTNGVYINGEQIDEHLLVDGDTVSIADFEFDFHCPSAATTRQTVTLAMEDRAQAAQPAEDPHLLIQALRTVNQWSGLNRIDPGLTSVQSISDQKTVGHWCPLFRKAYQNHEETRLLKESLVLENPLRLLQHVSAMFALQERQEMGGFLLLELDQADFQRQDLLETVGWMRTTFGSSLKVVLGAKVELWEANLMDNPLVEDLRGMGAQLAVVGIDQFKPPIISEVLEHCSMIGVAASALSATSRSPAVANNIHEFIQEVSSTGCRALAQAGSSGPDNQALEQMGFHAIVRFPT
ncbi:Transcriptional regulatory protein EmbR [Bremerella volcania]|uniref:Transcriptional regulatory protein EmbR n=1 Tax=Bremerella volcania TaxID=2527984 RepID=A0A518C7B0_9BACT|nr:FHA domain-containing protein [Bremerella volcania]QDU75092.1 Transcriptional regulatory protein EmbR [Bremerella volcania]